MSHERQALLQPDHISTIQANTAESITMVHPISVSSPRRTSPRNSSSTPVSQVKSDTTAAAAATTVKSVSCEVPQSSDRSQQRHQQQQQQRQTTSPTNSTDAASPTRGTKRGKKIIVLSEQQLRTHYIFSQPEAARRLGVSLSTLKRRFYELHSGKRWPYHDLKPSLKKRRISFIVNKKDLPEKDIDSYTEHVLSLAFRNCTIPILSFDQQTEQQQQHQQHHNQPYYPHYPHPHQDYDQQPPSQQQQLQPAP